MNLRSLCWLLASLVMIPVHADEPVVPAPALAPATMPAKTAEAPASTEAEAAADAAAPVSAVALPEVAVRPKRDRKAVAYVIPVQDQIAQPTLYILRRGLKEAIEQKADVVLLDMKTPGGDAGTTLEIMEALQKFPGETVTYVNTEAGSAGAIIAMITDEIYFAPTGVMGAAELILGTGQDAPEALKRKMTSYIAAKAEALSASPTPRRAEVLKAMMNADFELKIGEEIISPKGELLTLSAKRAIAPYGDPPEPLLATGIVDSVEQLLTKKYGEGGYEIRQFRVTWSESLAQYLTTFAPVFMGLGMLLLFIEFKTPGFGWPGVSGLSLLAVVFFGHYVAGLSGQEPAVLFAVGLLLLGVELIFFPGVVFVALAGVALMLVSLLWAMADIWPDQPIAFSSELFLQPAVNLGLALVITAVLAVLLLRYLPKAWFWDRLVLSAAIDAQSQGRAVDVRHDTAPDALIGAEGITLTGMFPSGEVEVGGRRYAAQSALGHIPAGVPVVVTRRAAFGLLVERKSS
ncbi:MAG: hypothetical protein KBC32_08915 [Candidatus Didemnitutus sp.]|nr:hypothetical protein [Candidatus Didemnitutus sp.]